MDDLWSRPVAEPANRGNPHRISDSVGTAEAGVRFLIRFAHPSGCLRGSLSPLRSDSRVRGARFEFSGSIGFICSLLCNHATTYGTTPTRPGPAHQFAGQDAVFSVTLADRLSYLTTYEAVSIFGEMRVPLRPGCFAVYASQMLFRHPSALPGRASGCSLVTRWLPRSSMT